MINLHEVLSFCERHRIAESTFGRKAVGDPSYINRLRKGGDQRRATILRVRDFMAAMEATGPIDPSLSAMDRFAEAISNDFGEHPVTVRDAAQIAGISYDQGNSYIQRLRQRYRG